VGPRAGSGTKRTPGNGESYFNSRELREIRRFTFPSWTSQSKRCSRGSKTRTQVPTYESIVDKNANGLSDQKAGAEGKPRDLAYAATSDVRVHRIPKTDRVTPQLQASTIAFAKSFLDPSDGFLPTADASEHVCDRLL
jgi:hypothetical protein